MRLLRPARKRRAETRARLLLRSCLGEEGWAMYRDLGFLRVWGSQPDRPGRHDAHLGAPYAYLLYPRKPILAFVPQTGRLLSEYCVVFPDETRPGGVARLPDADDVLAKWMALTADERRLIEIANVHRPGCDFDPRHVQRDVWRLRRWEQERAARQWA